MLLRVSPKGIAQAMPERLPAAGQRDTANAPCDQLWNRVNLRRNQRGLSLSVVNRASSVSTMFTYWTGWR